MRIGIVTGEYPPMQGGVGAYTAILAQHLNDCGHDIHLFSTRQAQSNSLSINNTIEKWGLGSLHTIRQWASSSQLDLINLQFQTAAYGMSPWIHFLPDAVRRIPIVTTFHDLRFPYLFPKAGPLRDWIVMHLAQRSAGVIVTNHEDAALIEHLRQHRLIPIGSNMLSALPENDDPQRWRTIAGAAKDDFLLAYFGLINRSKGLETLLESVAALHNEGIPARLLIIGGVAGSSDSTNTAYIAEFEQRIEQLNLTDCIHRTGFIESDTDVGGFLNASDAVVLPFRDGASFRRGSLMAGIHYGCPIVTTIPSVHVPEFVHSQNMLLVPPGDIASLTTALRQLYTMPEIRQHLRQGAAQLATHFDWKQIARDYLGFFESIIGDGH